MKAVSHFSAMSRTRLWDLGGRQTRLEAGDFCFASRATKMQVEHGRIRGATGVQFVGWSREPLCETM